MQRAATGLFFFVTALAAAQPAPPRVIERDVAITLHGAAGAVGVTDSIVVGDPNAGWVRVRFDAPSLGEAMSRGATVRVMSLLDGAVQELNTQSLAWWGGTSAYFNGGQVAIDLVAHGDAAPSSIVVAGVTLGLASGPFADRSICGATDDRTPSTAPACGRYMPTGCTAWIINDANHMFLTAGHCFVGATGVVEFNVPLSLPDGTLVHPHPRDQYPVETSSVQSAYVGVGNDWTYFGTYPSNFTGLTAYQAQRAFYPLAREPFDTPGGLATVTGYGAVQAPTSLTWTQTQKTHSGPFSAVLGTTVSYAVDTSTGNSGSPVWSDTLGAAVAIHTNAGCTVDGGSNSGTSVLQPGLQAALASPRGICRSGTASRTGSLYAVGDAVNNFGVINESTGGFGLVAQVAPSMQGLAYDLVHDIFYAVDFDRELFTINPDTGSATRLGLILGNPAPITGLGYDPANGILWGLSQSDGRLYRINTTTLWVTGVGGALGGNIGGIEFDPDTGTLFGLDDTASGTMLVRISTSTGERTPVGLLGPGITDCNGLAYNTDRMLYTINAGSDLLYRIDPTTGAAASVGPTGALFGSGFGLTARLRPSGCSRLDFNQDGNLDQDDVAALLDAIAGGPSPNDPDINADGSADQSDIWYLINAIAGGPC